MAEPPSCGLLEHTADLIFWVEADSLAGLFEAGPPALARLMAHGPRRARPQWLCLELCGRDYTGLWVALLNEVVFRLDAQGLLVTAHRVVRLSPTSLGSRLGVIPWQTGLHLPGEPVKAVTYHQAEVKEQRGRWRGQVVLDV